MKTQYEKNYETLEEELEKYSEMPMSNAVAERLSIYHGALKALCHLKKEEYHEEEKTAPTASESKRTVELDGDTEFEKIVMEIPIDAAHVKAVYNIIADHMESLAVMNRRAYDNVMMRLREVSRD